MTVHAPWPFLRMRFDLAPDDDIATLLTALAVNAGATGSASETGGLTFYFDVPRNDGELAMLRDVLCEEAAALGRAMVFSEIGAIQDAPWATAWQTDFKDTPIGKRLLVRPEWLRDTPIPVGCENRLAIILLPGQGFGTGRHETTRLALEMLEAHLKSGDRVLDFGTGSGILSIAAIALGASRAVGIDYDAAALENARDNLALNGMADRIQFVQGNDPACLVGSFDLIVCNALPKEALPVLGGLAARLSGPAARLVHSGFLVEQRDEIAAALAAAGLRATHWDSQGEWGAAICTHAALN